VDIKSNIQGIQIHKLQRKIEADLKITTNPKLEAELILSFYLNCSRFELYLKNNKLILPETIEKINDAVIQRQNNVPLQYIFKEAYFGDLRFYIDPDVLIPRPETELLVETVLFNIEPKKPILDIGTGSGVISILLAKKLPDTEIIATDISKKAINVAKKNADLHQVNIEFILSDIFENISTKFDVIVSNPPYISQKEYVNLPDEIKKYEPRKALLAQDDGYFFFNKILSQGKKYLNQNGKIFFEIGSHQSNKINDFATKYGFEDIITIKDLNNFDRIMIISL